MAHKEVKLSCQQREVLYRNIDEHNRALYRGLPVECEYGYTCVKCHRPTDLDSSYSNQGYNMVCHKCAQELAHSSGMTIGEYVVKYVHSRDFKSVIV